ncbi:MAG: ABC-2 transporter permease [Peptoniphilaceae bacterium]
MNALKVFKLDILSIRPYLTIKNLIILIGLGTLYGALSKNPVFVMVTAQMFAMLFSGYPFMVGEEDGIDPLYKLFSIDPKDVVKGRYLLATVAVIIMLVIGVILAIIIGFVWSIENLLYMLLYTTPITGFIVLTIIFIEYPIYFKYGYKKGKTLASMPMLLLAICAVCYAYFGEYFKPILKFITINKFAGMGLIFGTFFILLLISLRFSNKLYSKRDF